MNLRGASFGRRAAFILIAVLTASGAAATVWAQSGGGPAVPSASQQVAPSGTIVIIKDSVPDDPQVFNFSGSGGLGPFSLDDDPATLLPNTRTFTNLPPDLYTITELFPIPGWFLMNGSVCKFPDGSTTTFGSQATFNLAAGATVTCTFTNYKAGNVIVDKVTIPAGDPTLFQFTAAWGFFSLQDTSPSHDSGPIPPTGQGSFFYGLSETPVLGWKTTIACKDPDGGTTAAGNSANIDLDPGETITCIVTNRKDVVDVKLGTIIIIKDAVPDDPQVFDFEGSLGPFSLDDDPATLLLNTRTFTNLPPGPYTVTEKGPPSDWVLSIACKDPDGGTTVAGNSANIDLDAGEIITCIFTNKKDIPPHPATTTYIYSVKIVCGTVTPPRPKPSIPTLRDPAPVVPGLYRTAVNIHNFWEKDTVFLQKVAIALPQDQARGPVTRKVQAKLGPNEAVEVDCYNVVAILEGTTAAKSEFLKGFVVIESPVELEVTAVYTAEELQENGISIDVEQINPHIVKKETPRGLDLAVSKGQEGAFPIGGVGVYVIKVTANGVANPPIKVTDTLPFGFTFIPNSATPPWTCTVTTPANPPTVQEVVECSYPAALAANATVALMFKVNVNPLAAIPPGPNCAEVKHPQDTNPANDKSCVEVILQASGATPAPASTPTRAGRPGG